MDPRGPTPAERDQILRRMRVPLACFVGLIVLLGVNLGLSVFFTFPHLAIAQLLVLVVMVSIVLLYSMEIVHEPPLIRLFSIVGFCWVAILFAMTFVDYTTR